MNDTDLAQVTLDVTLVDAGPVANGYATDTSDNCGSGNTSGSACVTKPDAVH